MLQYDGDDDGCIRMRFVSIFSIFSVLVNSLLIYDLVHVMADADVYVYLVFTMLTSWHRKRQRIDRVNMEEVV